MKFINFFYFCESFLPSWIRIRDDLSQCGSGFKAPLCGHIFLTSRKGVADWVSQVLKADPQTATAFRRVRQSASAPWHASGSLPAISVYKKKFASFSLLKEKFFAKKIAKDQRNICEKLQYLSHLSEFSIRISMNLQLIFHGEYTFSYTYFTTIRTCIQN